ncbi:MAG: nicotinamide riboside transporter PnuC [Brevinemataceae bacterium]
MKNNYFDRIFLSFFSIISLILISIATFKDIGVNNIYNVSNILKISISFTASFLGIIFVILESMEKYSMFFIGILASLLSLIYLWIWSPLIWDIFISYIYIILNIFGAYYWKVNKNPDNQLTPTKILSKRQIVLYSLTGILGIICLSMIGITLGRYSSIVQAVFDAVTTILAILAQWMISKKILEAWYLWIAVNIISIPLYISIGSYTYAASYLCYGIISLYGLQKWKKNILLPN